jgi:hypothetical protein
MDIPVYKQSERPFQTQLLVATIPHPSISPGPAQDTVLWLGKFILRLANYPTKQPRGAGS